MAFEGQNQDIQYDSLPILDISQFPQNSFLRWDYKHFAHQLRFFEGVQSVEDALKLLLEHFPNLRIVRGSGLANPLGANGDFFVGNLASALHYTDQDIQQKKRELPIVVTASLQEIMKLLNEGGISVLHYDGDVKKFPQEGVIKISYHDYNPNKLFSCFEINRPPNSPIDQSKFANFKPSFKARLAGILPRK